MKDRFSQSAELYAQFRPTYPPSLYENVLQHVKHKKNAWDVGTGNGQVAVELANHFQQVKATDISADQLQFAPAKPNIEYAVLPAEKTNFEDGQFDLVTVAQAIHWFQLDAFYKEVNRTLQPGGVLAVWGYGLITTVGTLTHIIADFYRSLHNYWDAERKHIDHLYKSIAFPFAPIEVPPMRIHVQWTPEQLVGYLSTWSAVAQFVKQEGFDPVEKFRSSIIQHWGANLQRDFYFPIFMKLGTK